MPAYKGGQKRRKHERNRDKCSAYRKDGQRERNREPETCAKERGLTAACANRQKLIDQLTALAIHPIPEFSRRRVRGSSRRGSPGPRPSDSTVRGRAGFPLWQETASARPVCLPELK